MTPRAQPSPNSNRSYQETHQQEPSPRKQSPLRPPVGWDISSQAPIPYQRLGPSQQTDMQSHQPSHFPADGAAAAPGQLQPAVDMNGDPLPNVNTPSTLPARTRSSGSPPAKRRRQDTPETKKNPVGRPRKTINPAPSVSAPPNGNAPQQPQTATPQTKKNPVGRPRQTINPAPPGNGSSNGSAAQQAQSTPPKVASQAIPPRTNGAAPILPGLPSIDIRRQLNFQLSLPPAPTVHSRGVLPSGGPATQAPRALTGPSMPSADTSRQPTLQLPLPPVLAPVPNVPSNGMHPAAFPAQARAFQVVSTPLPALTGPYMPSADAQRQQHSPLQQPFTPNLPPNGDLSGALRTPPPPPSAPQEGQRVALNAEGQAIPPSTNRIPILPGEVPVRSAQVPPHASLVLPGLSIPSADARRPIPSSSPSSSIPRIPSYGNLSGAFPVGSGDSQVPPRTTTPSNTLPPPPRTSPPLIRLPPSPVYSGVLESRADERHVRIAGTHIIADSVNTFLRRFVRLNNCQGPNPLYPTGGQMHRETMILITHLTIQWQSSCFIKARSYPDPIYWAQKKGERLGLAIFARAQALNMLYLMKGIREYFNDMANVATTTLDELKIFPAENAKFQKNGFVSWMGTQMLDKTFFTALVDTITFHTRRFVMENQAGVHRLMQEETGLQKAVRARQEAEKKKQTPVVVDGQEQQFVVESGFMRRLEKGPENEIRNSLGMTHDQLQDVARRALDQNVLERE